MGKQIKEIIFKSIKELNENLDEDQQLQLSTDTVLLGKDSNIDSITLVNLIVTIEESLEDNLNVSVTLADEKALSQKNSPFLTIQTLLDYIALLIKEHA
jgi:acyl carrier protein